jgi:hypothetical protein
VRRFVISATLGLMALLLVAAPAAAGRVWCSRDPIVALNGKTLQMWVSIPQEYQQYVSGAIQTTVLTPSTVTRTTVFTDTGFNGYGENIRYSNLQYCTLLLLCTPAKVAADGSYDVQVSTVVPINKNLLFNLLGASSIPLQLTIIYANGTSSTVEMTNDGARVTLHIQQ